MTQLLWLVERVGPVLPHRLVGCRFSNWPSPIVVKSKFWLRFCIITLLFGIFCWCGIFCHRTESDLFLFILDIQWNRKSFCLILLYYVYILGVLSGSLVSKFGEQKCMFAGSLISTTGFAMSFVAVNIPFLVATLGILVGMYFIHIIMSFNRFISNLRLTCLWFHYYIA